MNALETPPAGVQLSVSPVPTVKLEPSWHVAVRAACAQYDVAPTPGAVTVSTPPPCGANSSVVPAGPHQVPPAAKLGAARDVTGDATRPAASRAAPQTVCSPVSTPVNVARGAPADATCAAAGGRPPATRGVSMESAYCVTSVRVSARTRTAPGAACARRSASGAPVDRPAPGRRSDGNRIASTTQHAAPTSQSAVCAIGGTPLSNMGACAE